jgi:hypothetical protein
LQICRPCPNNSVSQNFKIQLCLFPEFSSGIKSIFVVQCMLHFDASTDYEIGLSHHFYRIYTYYSRFIKLLCIYVSYFELNSFSCIFLLNLSNALPVSLFSTKTYNAHCKYVPEQFLCVFHVAKKLGAYLTNNYKLLVKVPFTQRKCSFYFIRFALFILNV